MKNIKDFILESNDVIKQFYNSHKDICRKPEYNGTGRIVISIHDKNILANAQKLDSRTFRSKFRRYLGHQNGSRAGRE